MLGNSRNASSKLADLKKAEGARKEFEESKRAFETVISDKYKQLVALKESGDIQGGMKTLREFETYKRVDYEAVQTIRTQLHTASAISRLKSIDSGDTKGLANAYSELSRLNPESAEYAEKAAKYATALKQAEITRVARQSEAIIMAQKEKEKKIKEITASLVASKDEVEAITWYRHKLSPSTSVIKALSTYIGSKNGSYWLRLKISYTADDWLFIKGFTFNIDGKNHPLQLAWGERKNDNSGGKIWEWVDIAVDAEALALLAKIAASKRTILRYEGQQYHFDRDISSTEKKAIREIIAAYLVLSADSLK